MRAMRILLAALLFPAALHAGVVSNPNAGRGPSTVNFNVQPYELLERYTAAQGRMNDALKTVLQVPGGQRNFANTVLAMERAGAEFGEAITQLIFLAYVSPNAELQQAAQMVEEDAGKYSVALMSRQDLYQAVKEVADAKPALSVEDQRLLDGTMLGYKHAGMGLAESERAKLTGLQERLTVLETQFQGNLNKVFPGLELSLEDLKGLPEDYIQSLKKTDEGKYKVTLSYPDYIPFMKLAENGELRRQLQLKYKTRAAEENGPLLVEAINLRHSIAKTLGYPSYPHMALVGRTAQTPEKVWDFLTGLWSVVAGQGRREEEALLEQKRKTQPEAVKVESWETGYYADKLKKRLYGYDSEEVKKYFPVERVIDGTMKLYQDLFHVTFTEVKEPKEGERWHEDAKLYQITDTATGKEIGHFYMDLHPREGKYGHAAAFSLVKGRELESGDYRQAVSAMVANFPAPSPGKPALVPFGDVETFFHEFGHIMHQTLTTARHASQSGSSVARDFVEAPSQMLENFVWDRRVIDLISGHYEDPSKKLPEELFSKMKEARGFNQSIGYLGQLAYAMADMTLHAAVPVDTSALFNTVLRMVTGEVAQPGSRADASFGHLMGGYDAGYYGYLWSLVYAEDIFSVFAENGVISPETGLRYRRTILEKGSSQPEMDTLAEFLGRQPSEKAFMEGLAPPLTLEDRYWALRRIISERAKLFTEADEIDGLDVHLKNGKLWFRIVLWPESMENRTEADVIELVRKRIPEMKDLEVEFTWLGVGA
jgi:thimet oligopeptidase